MTQAIIWDWNGTLLDDAEISYFILNKLLCAHGFNKVDGISDYRRIFGFPIIDYYRRAGFDFVKVSYEELAVEYTELYKKLVKSCPLHEGVREVLSEIKGRGLSQIILSASKHSLLCEQIEMFGLSKYFTELVGTSDIYAASKIDSALLWKKRNNYTDMLMCGDTLHDFEVAGKIDAKAVLFCKGHHASEALIQTGAPVIDNLNDILQHISF